MLKLLFKEILNDFNEFLNKFRSNENPSLYRKFINHCRQSYLYYVGFILWLIIAVILLLLYTIGFGLAMMLTEGSFWAIPTLITSMMIGTGYIVLMGLSIGYIQEKIELVYKKIEKAERRLSE